MLIRLCIEFDCLCNLYDIVSYINLNALQDSYSTCYFFTPLPFFNALLEYSSVNIFIKFYQFYDKISYTIRCDVS